MIGSVSGIDRWSLQLPVSVRDTQTRRLDSYLKSGGAVPAPQKTVLAEVGLLPFPLESLQKVQALLAETSRLTQQTTPPSLADRARLFALERPASPVQPL